MSARWCPRQSTGPWPPGGKLRHEGSLHLGQGQVPGPRLALQFVQQAGVRGPGVQLVLLQEILPPLRPEEHQCFSSGNSARLGEKESSVKEAFQPAQCSAMSEASARAAGSSLLRAPGPAWVIGSSICGPRELGVSCQQQQGHRSCAQRAAPKADASPDIQARHAQARLWAAASVSPAQR
nr:cysteine-rich DPF motif domain-containing protein 1 isoform X1 [Microcebus murinus]